MKKVIFLAALGLSVMAQAAEPGYFKTLVAEQADATKGQTQLYNLDYYADGSLLLLSSYSTASKDEVGLHFDGDTYQGGTASTSADKCFYGKSGQRRYGFMDCSGHDVSV